MYASQSSRPTVEHHEYGSEDSNNVETKVQPSSVHRETVASTKRENPGLLASSSGGSGSSSNPSSIASEKEVHLYKERKSIERTEFGTTIFWMTDVQKTLRCYSHLQERVVQHHDED